MKQFVEKAKKHELLQKLKFHAEQLPVALRWNMHPEFGFPRAPFSVYRRVADYSGMPVNTYYTNSAEPVTSEKTIELNNDLYLIIIGISIQPGQELTVTPIGKGGVRIPSKAFTFGQTGTVLIKTPFIQGIHFEGQGTLTELRGIPQQAVVESSNWQRIQRVGLPFRKGEIGNQGYAGDPQGFDPHALTDAKTAALLRLEMGAWLYTPPLPLQSFDPQVGAIPWEFPDPAHYLNFLSSGSDSQLDSIRQCLEKSDDFSYNRNRRQAAYLHKTSIPGISQTGTLGASTVAEALIPVVSQTLLSVSAENPAALGLGFGTYDFIESGSIRLSTSTYERYAAAVLPKTIANTGLLDLACDYMVGASYVLRPMEQIELPIFDFLSKEVEFCALGEEAPALVSVAQLEVMGIQKNRPERLDLQFTEAVKLRWKPWDNPTGYGMAVCYDPGISIPENEPYPFQKDAYFSLFSAVPKNIGGDVLTEDRNKAIHTFPEEPLPFTGSKTYKYFIAPWDVFGRWGPWSRLLFQANAPAKQKPGIMAIRLFLPNGEDFSQLDPLVPQVSCGLEIEFSWDWIDRSPDRIELSGRFFDAGLAAPPSPDFTRFSRSASDTSTPTVVITFDGSGINQTPTVNQPLGGSQCSVHLLSSSIPVDSSGDPTFGSQDGPSANLRKYRLLISGMEAYFTGATPYAVAYTAAIRGLEKVRASASDWSDWSTGYVTRLSDPRPPEQLTLGADVQFTAFPDATRMAKGLLTWPVAAGAVYYHIWEASEIALRTALEPALRADFPGQEARQLLPLSASLVERATQLRELLLLPRYAQLCQKSFSRLTKNPLNTRTFQVELPGSSEVLYLYAISSVNSGNIESKKSNPAFFAVPRVSRPEAPAVQLLNHPLKGSDGTRKGLEVRVFTTAGALPRGYQLYRIRKMPLNSDVGNKGLPLLAEDSPLWEEFEMRMLDGTTYPGKRYFETAIAPGWKPLVYQAVAVGAPDPDRGIYAGESVASATQIGWYMPKSPPSLLVLSMVENAYSRVFTLSTSAPFEQVASGGSRIEVYRIGVSGERSLIYTIPASETRLATADLSLAASAAAAAALPLVNHQKMELATGLSRFSVAVPAGTDPLILRISDPRGQVNEVELTH